MDPIIKKQRKLYKLKKIKQNEVFDIYKADIYSLGISFYQIMTGESIELINRINIDCY